MVNCGGVDPPPITENARVGRQTAWSTVTLLVDAQDEVAQPGRPILGELSLEIIGRPESDDLDEPAPPRIASMHQREVGEDERGPCAHRFRFANDVPVERHSCEVAREALFDATVETAWLDRRKDRIAGGELHHASSAVEDAGREQVEAAAPRQHRQ